VPRPWRSLTGWVLPFAMTGSRGLRLLAAGRAR